MDHPLFETLHRQQLITDGELDAVKQQQHQPLSVHNDLIAILYAGIIMLTSGVGILVYENIDTIGHKVLIALIAAASLACFAYCFKNSKGFSVNKVKAPTVLFDYILLLGCLLLLTGLAYLQYVYQVFGNRYGLATFFPMVVLFATAYYFDHLGILSLAITNLAAWAGLTVTPLQVFKNNDFSNGSLIITALSLGCLLMLLAWLSVKKHIKAHFAFTYTNFAAHLLFIGLLAAMFHYDRLYLLWFLVLALYSFAFFNYAIKEQSFYFVLITSLYAYIGVSYVVVDLLSFGDAFVLICFYFILSGVGLISLLMRYNKSLKQHEGI